MVIYMEAIHVEGRKNCGGCDNWVLMLVSREENIPGFSYRSDNVLGRKRIRPRRYHVVVTHQGKFNGDTKDKCNMFHYIM